MLPLRIQPALGIVAVLLIAGCSDAPTGPVVDDVTPRFSEEGGSPSDCETQIIVDEGCDPGSGPTATTTYFASLDGETSVDYALIDETSLSSTVSGSMVSCPPGFYKNLVPATLFPPGESPLPIVSSGWFAIIFGELPDPYGRYMWPGGFWPATDGSGREVKIGTADAVCRVFRTPRGFTINVSFFRYNDVEIRYPPTPGGGDGGGGGGGDDGCREEWVVVEIDYGDGTGWHVLWEGWATVCE